MIRTTLLLGLALLLLAFLGVAYYVSRNRWEPTVFDEPETMFV